MIKVEDIEEPIRELYRSILGVAPSSILAGGYLRDLDNGKEAKDIDFFIEERHKDDVKELVETLGFEECDYYESAKCDVSVVDQLILKTSRIKILPVNVIAARDTTVSPIERFQRFDFGICQIAFDGTDIIRTKEYETDKAHKVFRLRRPMPMGDFEYHWKRYRRIGHRYVGWNFVLPQELIAPKDVICIPWTTVNFTDEEKSVDDMYPPPNNTYEPDFIDPEDI